VETKINTIIFDASVLVSGNVSGEIYKTGLFRVSHEVLTFLSEQKNYELFLFDVFNREREIKKYVQKEFPGCRRIKIYSGFYNFLFFPLGDFLDLLRLQEQKHEYKANKILVVVA
jgi:hypothetical protein